MLAGSAKSGFRRLVFFVALLAFGSAVPAQVLLDLTFDGETDDASTALLLEDPLIHLETDSGVDGTGAIRVDYVGFDRGSKRAVVVLPLDGIVDEATLSFDVRFAEDFKWVRGGKLHGLGPERRVTGGRPRQPDGWSSRMMFRSGGRISTYLYDQDPVVRYGVGDTSEDPFLKAGQWHHVVLRVKLNTPEQPDGYAQILIDGREAVRTKGVTFRGVGGEATRIQNFLFSTFHGGSDPRFAPVDSEGAFTIERAWFDNFKVVAGIH